MVCNRCIKVVGDELVRHKIAFAKVNLGSIQFIEEITDRTITEIGRILSKEGFELLKTKDKQIISQIKALLIQRIHQEGKKSQQSTSSILTAAMGMDYSYLSKLFSEVEGRTIEKYMIHLKIEKVKELLRYGELSPSQISYELDYSSPQHVSRQFKQVTGLTPTQFKTQGKRKNIDTI